MKRVPSWCKQVLAAIAIVFLAAQSAFAMSILSPDDGDDYHLYRQVSKRQHHDPWDLCPDEMPSVDCFYVYLRVYAQLRREVANEDPDRMVGKRAQEDPFSSLGSSSGSWGSYTPSMSMSSEAERSRSQPAASKPVIYLLLLELEHLRRRRV